MEHLQQTWRCVAALYLLAQPVVLAVPERVSVDSSQVEKAEQMQEQTPLQRAQLSLQHCEQRWQRKHQAPPAGVAAAAAQEEAAAAAATAKAAAHARRAQLQASKPEEAAQAAQAWRARCRTAQRSAPVQRHTRVS